MPGPARAGAAYVIAPGRVLDVYDDRARPREVEEDGRILGRPEMARRLAPPRARRRSRGEAGGGDGGVAQKGTAVLS